MDRIIALVLFHHMQAAKRARKGTLLRDPGEATEMFGPLEAVLGAVPAVFANREVGSRTPRISPLTNEFSTGIRRCGKQD